LLKENFKDKKVMITGGLGFIGSALAHRLVEVGANVLLVDSLIPEYGGNVFNIDSIKDKVVTNFSDVRDQFSMNYLVQGQDFIFNMAGTLSHTDSMTDPFTDLAINCTSQLALLESCRKHNPGVKIIFAGTRGEYGRVSKLPANEETPLNPIDVNGINNIAGEQYHILYYKVYGIRTTSLRLTNTFGPRHQMRHHKQGIINWFIRQVIENKEIKIFGNGTQIRDTNYIDDVVEAFLLAAIEEQTNGEVYNIGGTPTNLLDRVKMLLEIHGAGSYKLVPFPEKNKVIEIGDYIADYSKFQKLTGWSPQWELRDGLEKTIGYYCKNREYYF
jgi:UDP-glucose 4-epimerase